MKKHRVTFVSVVPSPYQRDLFAALAARADIALRVFYLEATGEADSPWPPGALAEYEAVLPGRWFPVGKARCHWNWPLPSFREDDLVVCNTLMSFTAQYLMRGPLRQRRWAFWGERLQTRSRPHDVLTSPLRRATAIVGIGSRATREYAGRFPRPAHFNIPYHCELAPFLAQPAARHEGGDVHFLFCGQMIARKGLDVLLAAFSTLERARLHLVGREADLAEFLSPLSAEVRARIIYHGFHAPERLPEFFSLAHVFILPSRYDGWGVVINQALGAGRPIIASDAVYAAHDFVTPGENGMIFPVGSVPDLAAAMRAFLAQPELIERYGASSRQRAVELSPARGAEKWAAAITQITTA